MKYTAYCTRETEPFTGLHRLWNRFAIRLPWWLDVPDGGSDCWSVYVIGPGVSGATQGNSEKDIVYMAKDIIAMDVCTDQVGDWSERRWRRYTESLGIDLDVVYVSPCEWWHISGLDDECGAPRCPYRV